MLRDVSRTEFDKLYARLDVCLVERGDSFYSPVCASVPAAAAAVLFSCQPRVFLVCFCLFVCLFCYLNQRASTAPRLR